ncbi:hypothetical protein C2G38_2213467 [Gigaspora rosea]|uniref:Uncharacterized protein n=1 Tax=Gigaspora rosea TaxID=44941 RepID=A0A397UF97_9GLOM|nr:hypothetical protein C2G38_2213467 [Gigaspora rosea]
MPKLSGPCVITICNTICSNCYNGIAINCSFKFKQHSEESNRFVETEVEIENANTISFSQAIATITNILYEREVKEKKPTIYLFDELKTTMEQKDESDVALYLDSVGASDSSIDTLADLGVTTTSRTVARHKTAISEEHANAVNSILAQYMENAMVLNINDYHSIHTKRVPNTTTTSDAAHLATILINPIMIQPAISNIDIHNPLLVDAELIKRNIATKFMTLYSFSHNQRWGFQNESSCTNPKPWRINLLLEISRSAWQEISSTVEAKFRPLCKDAEYLALKDLLDNMIPLVLDIYAIFFWAGDFDVYFESCFRVWTLFFKFQRKNYTKAPLMFLSDIFYWELNNHSILDIIKNELPKFSDSTTSLTSKRKCDENNETIPLIAMNMPEAQLCHLPLGFSFLFKLDLSRYCDASNLPTQELKKNTCDDDDEVVPVRYKALTLEEALQKFQSQ